MNKSTTMKRFDPQIIEPKWRLEWEKRGHATLAFTKERSNFSIQLPPPNVTGTLHMGHAFNQTIIDSLIRYHRMLGKNILSVPGTDHAGIATQIIIERQLNAYNISRHDIGREKFIEYAWKWKEKSGSIITTQIRRLGVSPDWSHEYFTMNDKMSIVVRDVFITLYEQGLIYRGKRLVNWDPVLMTAVSDLEVSSEEESSYLWYIRYPLVNCRGELVIATTRPETMLGDVAVMINPKDSRYKHLIGKYVTLPLCNRTIPVIADDYVDPKFGTGVVKVTPAHDFNDYQISLRHRLTPIEILTLDAKINDNAPVNYRGLDRLEARKALVADLNEYGFLSLVEPHKLMVPRGDRTGAIIEPMLTNQWFVAMKKPAPHGTFNPGKSITDISLDAVRTGKIQFIPKNWTTTYYKWLENIQDWCISRQLWWGHQIPAWYGENGEIFVARDESCAYAQAKEKGYIGNLKRDDDVLDTWFSSALVPFSSLGWPDDTQELKQFLPSSVLVTGFDIIFFWVARMVMMTTHFTGKIPFQTVYIHGLVRDSQGQKMSKSKGNTLDPIDIIDGIDLNALIAKRTIGLINQDQAAIIEKKTRKEFPNGIQAFGTDALRFTMASIATLGRDLNFDLSRCEGYRNFCNKLWNATRFVLMNCEGYDYGFEYLKIFSKKDSKLDSSSYLDFSKADLWIVSLLQRTKADITKGFEDYRFDNIAISIYRFVWDEYCDWYIELAKVQIQNGTTEQKRATRLTLLRVLETVLRLAHPIIPFITEELWQKVEPLSDYFMKSSKKSESTTLLMKQEYPILSLEEINYPAEQWITNLKMIVEVCRNMRSKINLSPAKKIPLLALGDVKILEVFTPYIKALAQLSEVQIFREEEIFDNIAKGLPIMIVGKNKLALKVDIDVEAERSRITKEIARLTCEIKKCSNKLNNIEFVTKAPQIIVEQERKRIDEFHNILDRLHEQLRYNSTI
ncbi:MAG: valine--tRNA ligase [Burkholderia sp.]|nr:valine--tRNA ligase [Burkholderia sp.]